MKQLYILRKSTTGYDQYAEMVIRATSAKEARHLANLWFDSKISSCKKLSSRGRVEIILTDFCAR